MRCPNCSNEEIEILSKKMEDKMHFIPGRFSLLRCKNCSLEFLFPMLDEEQLARYYPEKEYYSFQQKKLARMYHKLSAFYSSSILGKILFFAIGPLLQGYHFRNGARILEIGCGDGLGLEIYQERGMETRGLEPYGPKLSERDKKLGIERKSIGKVQYPENHFDYIIMREVLEHIPGQDEVLRRCYKWLKPSGKLVIIVPNTRSLWRRLFHDNWCGYDAPRHVYDYDPRSISFILKKHNFKIKRIKKFDLPYMLYGSIKFAMRRKSDFSMLTKLFFLPLSLIISFLKMGSLIEVNVTK